METKYLDPQQAYIFYDGSRTNQMIADQSERMETYRYDMDCESNHLMAMKKVFKAIPQFRKLKITHFDGYHRSRIMIESHGPTLMEITIISHVPYGHYHNIKMVESTYTIDYRILLLTQDLNGYSSDGFSYIKIKGHIYQMEKFIDGSLIKHHYRKVINASEKIIDKEIAFTR